MEAVVDGSWKKVENFMSEVAWSCMRVAGDWAKRHSSLFRVPLTLTRSCPLGETYLVSA